MTERSQFFGALLIVALVAAACGGGSNNTAVAPTATLRGAIVPTRVSLTPSNTPTSTATATPTATDTATVTPTATDTPTNTATATATDTATATFTPTVDAAEVQAFVDDGNTFTDQEQYDQALDAFNSALALNPDSADALYGRGLVYLYTDDYWSAIDDYDRLIELDPGEVDAYYYRGLAFAALGEHEAAIDDFTSVIALTPDDSYAFAERAYSFVELGDYDSAFGDLSRALELDPRNDYAYETRGYLYYELGDYESALTDFRRYVTLVGEDNEDVMNIIAELEARLASDVTPVGPVANVTPLAFGEPQSGRIQGEVFAFRYSFEARAGDMVGIRMSVVSGTLDPLLVLIDPLNNEVARNDDDPQGTSRDSYLRNFRIPVDGTYIVVATRFQEALGTTEGEFRLVVESSGTPVPPTAVPDVRDIPIFRNEPLEGEITDRVGLLRYTFPGEAGDIISIKVVSMSGSLDPQVILLDPAGNEIARNDDDPQGSTGDSYLRDFQLPSTGQYVIIATRFQESLGTTEGRFVITLEGVGGNRQPRVTPQPQGDVELPPGVLPLPFNQPIEGVIDGNTPEVRYGFMGRVGVVVGIKMNVLAGTLDPVIILLDPAGNEIARNDDDPQATGRDSYLREFTLPADGIYIVIATRFQEARGTTEGRFEVILEGAGRAPVGGMSQGNGGPINYGASVTGVINGEVWAIEYTFEGRAGDVIGIQMTTNDMLDPAIALIGPGGNEIAYNDDDPEGTGRDSYLRDFELPVNGIYTIRATRFEEAQGDSEGAFTLTLEHAR